MFKVVVCLGDKAGFVKVEDTNLVITPDIQSASKFQNESDGVCCVLMKARESFPSLRFVVASCPSVIFGERPRNVVAEEVILNDTSFHSADCELCSYMCVRR